MHDLYMGVDIGTSGVRAALFNVEGKLVTLTHKEYAMICTVQGMSELDPELVFSSTIEVIKSCVQKYGGNSNKIQAIGFCSQLFSIMAVDKDGKCLTNIFTWADNRAINHSKIIEERYDCQNLYRATGCRPHHPMYPLSKLLWLKEMIPELVNNTYKFISIKEYIISRLFSEYVIDLTDASTTAFFNISQFKWDNEILRYVLDIKEEKFGEVVDCTHTLRKMKKEYAEAMQLRADIPVVIGSGDGIMANLGCGVFDDSAMSSTIGTSGALRIAVNKPLLDDKQRTWCYCFTKDTWVAGGAINNGGIILKWIRENFKDQFTKEAQSMGEKSIYSLFDRYAKEIPAGSDGLIFLPLLTGERSPNWNASARGIISGLDLYHDKRHLIKAAMEGVIYRMNSVFEVISSMNSNVQQIRANGGYSMSDIWLQIQADVFGKEIAVAGVEEAAVFGTAYLAMYSVGAISSLKQSLPAMQINRIIKPQDSNRQLYINGFEQFKEIYRKFYG